MSDEKVAEAKAALRIAIFDHMSTVPAKAGQYDITRFVTNTTFTNNSKDGWTFTKSGWGWY